MKYLNTLAAAALALSAPANAADDMIGVSFAGDVYTIDSDTGHGNYIANSGAIALNAMAISPTGKVYAGNVFGAIYEIDPVSALATQIATVSGDIRSMAINSSNVLYAVYDGGDSGNDSLYKIDLNSFSSTFLGDTGLTGIQALAFNKNDVLYAFEVEATSQMGSGLNTINTNTGAATDVNPNVGWSGGPSVQFLSFSSSGKLVGGTSSLYEISTTTGMWSFIGLGGYVDLRGADFLCPASAQPATWALYGNGHPGKFGVPQIKLTADPKLGTTPSLAVSSSTNTLQTSVAIMGLSQDGITGSWGGVLHVKPLVVLSLPIPSSGWTIPLPFPYNSALCGKKVYFQMIQSDPAASAGASSTQGLSAKMGL